jgi:hypothetical protein
MQQRQLTRLREKLRDLCSRLEVGCRILGQLSSGFNLRFKFSHYRQLANILTTRVRGLQSA